MFSFNDGRLHSTVEAVIGGTYRVPLTRAGSTTQYTAPLRDIQRLRQLSSAERRTLSFAFDVDGHLMNESPSLMTGTPEKSLGRDTPYVHARSTHGGDRPARLIYVIPGNPGLCEFYADFVAALSELVPNAAIAAVSYLGYNVDTPDDQAPLFMLDEQVQHKVDFLHFFHTTVGRDLPVYVLGHSVGAWIAQRIAHRRSEVVFVGLMAPTIKDIALSERGRNVTSLTRYVGTNTVWAAVWALKWVPFYQIVVMQLLRRIMPISEITGIAREATLGIALSPTVCRQIVGLAIEEMQRIGPDIEPIDIRGFWANKNRRIWALFAEHDHWVSPESRAAIVELSRGLPHMLTEQLPVPHSFVLRDSETVAALAARQILETGPPGPRS